MQKVKGFTMVELSLAMAFVTVLSLIVVMIIVDAVASYRRGLTLNQINTTGMELVEDIRKAVQASPARSLIEECTELYSGTGDTSCRSDDGKSLMTVKRYGKVRVNNSELDNVPLYGAFCTGKYSYIWNSGYFFSENTSVVTGGMGNVGVKLKYKIPQSSGSGTEEHTTDGTERLLKLVDEDKMVCKAVIGYNAAITGGGGYVDYDDMIRPTTMTPMTDFIDITDVIIEEEPVDLLKHDSFTNLALYDLTASVPAKSEGVNSAFYVMSFVLGTTQGSANINKAGNSCIPPEGVDNEFDYCAINKFNFAAQAIGG